MKLPQVHETEIYVNANGHLVIKQDQYPEEPVHVILPKTYAKVLVDQIQLMLSKDELADFVSSEEGGE
jgi:uncharacterized protein YpmB